MSETTTGTSAEQPRPPTIDFSIHFTEDGTQVSTKERVMKGVCLDEMLCIEVPGCRATDVMHDPMVVC
jgi:hypothetical protein